MYRKSWIIMAMLFVLLLVTACNDGDAIQTGGNTKQQTQGGEADGNSQLGSGQEDIDKGNIEKAKEPVHLKIMSHGTGVSEEQFQTMLIQPLAKHHPHITLEVIPTRAFEELIAAQSVPDLIASWSGPIRGEIHDLKLTYDLTNLVQKYNLDLNQFVENTVESYKQNGELYGIPYTQQFSSLYYNKDIFDKFGIDYPKDGMVWSEAIDLARKLTKKEDNVQYQGMHIDFYRLGVAQLSVSYVDGETGKAIVNNDGWKRVFNLMQELYDIPGNKPSNLWGSMWGAQPFMSEQTLAMYPSVNLIPYLKPASEAGLNWDISQTPTFPEAPDAHLANGSHGYMITSTSEHKDAAFEVILTALSDEVQRELSENMALAPVINKPALFETFGANVDYLQGKNLQSIFKSKQMIEEHSDKYGSEPMAILFREFEKFINHEFDVNTALRQAEEKMNQYVESLAKANE